MPIMGTEKKQRKHIKKARNLLTLPPEKREPGHKKLRDEVLRNKEHVEKLETELTLLQNRDIEGLRAHNIALKEKAGNNAPGNENTSVRVPLPQAEYIDRKAEFDAMPKKERPPILRRDKTIDDWWDDQVAGHERKLEEERGEYEEVYEDYKTLLTLQIEDFSGQKAIISELEFKNMISHFGGKLVQRLDDAEMKSINGKVAKKKGTIKTQMETTIRRTPENNALSIEDMKKKLKEAVAQELEKVRLQMQKEELTKANEKRLDEIKANQLHRINFKLDELNSEFKRLTGKKYEKEAN